MTEFNSKTHYPLTYLPRENTYCSFDNATDNGMLELAARQLVLGNVTKERAERGGWALYGSNKFDDLHKMGLAVLVHTINGWAYEPTELLMSRQTEVLAKRVTLEVMAKNMGLTIPVKFAKPAAIKHNYKAKGSMETLKDFLRDGENENAVNYAIAIGKPLFFGRGQDSSYCNAYYDIKKHTILGHEFFSGRNKCGDFNIIHLKTAMSASGRFKIKTRQEAINAAKSNIDTMNEFNKSAFDQHCIKYEQTSQYELQAIYLNEYADLRKAA